MKRSNITGRKREQIKKKHCDMKKFADIPTSQEILKQQIQAKAQRMGRS